MWIIEVETVIKRDIPRLGLNDPFPDPRRAPEHGLLALGGDFSPGRLISAYRLGIFPWPLDGYPYVWFCPDPRMVVRPSDVNVSRSLRKVLRSGELRVTFDEAFGDVIRACASTPRKDWPGTWIVDQVIRAYSRLHELGFAHSVETWHGDELVGGLYGVSVGSVFCGESMFHRKDDASKVAFVALAAQLDAWGYDMIDCQVHTSHLALLGAHEISRDRYLAQLATYVDKLPQRDRWAFELDLAELGAPRDTNPPT